MSCDQTLYLKLINMLLEELSKGQGAQNTRTYIQAIGKNSNIFNVFSI